MIAMRRLVFRGWGFEAGLRVHVIHPEKVPDAPVPTRAQRTASVADMLKRSDRIRNDIEALWRMHGGR